MAETLHGLDGGMPGRPALHVGLELPDGAQRGVDHDLGPVADAGIMTTPLDACAALPREGAATSFDGRLEDHRDWAAGHPAPSVTLRRFLTFWIRMHGVLCRWNSPATSPAWTSTRPCSSRPNPTNCRQSGPETGRGAYGVRKPRKVTCLRVTKPSFS